MPCPCPSCQEIEPAILADAPFGYTALLAGVLADLAALGAQQPAPDNAAQQPDADTAEPADAHGAAEPAETAEPAFCDGGCEQDEDACECPTCSCCDNRMGDEDSRRPCLATDCDWCDRCCDEGHCSACGTRMGDNRPQCPVCDDCTRCCECHTCEGCDERIRSGNSCDSCSYCEGCDQSVSPRSGWCGDCDRCDSCCECSDESSDDPDGETPMPRGRGHQPTWVRLLAAPIFLRGKRSPRNPSLRFISVEIEVAKSNDETRYQVDPAIRAWEGTAVVTDGSLPDGSGYEICTAPTSGDAFVERVEMLCAALTRAGAAVTEACGFHVHVDARELTFLAAQRLIRLYERVEEAMFLMVPPSRRQNTYCRRVRGSYSLKMSEYKGDAKSKIIHATYGVDFKLYPRDFHSRSKQKYDGARYEAMNLHSWFLRGTVEFRLAAGTTNAEKIINWAALCAGLLDWAAAHKDEDLDALPAGSLATLLQVAPTPEIRAWVQRRYDKFCDRN